MRGYYGGTSGFGVNGSGGGGGGGPSAAVKRYSLQMGRSGNISIGTYLRYNENIVAQAPRGIDIPIPGTVSAVKAYSQTNNGRAIGVRLSLVRGGVIIATQNIDITATVVPTDYALASPISVLASDTVTAQIINASTPDLSSIRNPAVVLLVDRS